MIASQAVRLTTVSVVVGLLGCAHGPQKTVVVDNAPSPSRLSGVWGAVVRATDAEGDERVERLELHLQHLQGRLLGFINRTTEWVSGDGRAFRCSGQPNLAFHTRDVVDGRLLASNRAEIAVMAANDSPAPSADCPLPHELPRRCSLVRVGDDLQARCGPRAFELQKRLGPPVPLALALGKPGTATGVWTWHHRSGDPQGDLKTEDEVWHLFQRGDTIEGYYDRRVLVRSRDGRRFVCNDRLWYSNLARFRLRGKVIGGRVHIKEVAYVTRPGSCETRERVLDEYRGLLSGDGRMIQLIWNKGSQQLHRRY